MIFCYFDPNRHFKLTPFHQEKEIEVQFIQINSYNIKQVILV